MAEGGADTEIMGPTATLVAAVELVATMRVVSCAARSFAKVAVAGALGVGGCNTSTTDAERPRPGPTAAVATPDDAPWVNLA